MRLAVACALLLTLAAPAAASQSADDANLATLEIWVASIRDHVPGLRDEAARIVAGFEQGRFEAAFPYMVLLLERAQSLHGGDGARAFDARFRGLRRDIDSTSAAATIEPLVARITFPNLRTFLRAAVMLHTDIAVADRTRHMTSAEGTGHVAADGRTRGEEGRSWHWLLARSFLHLTLIDWSDARRPVVDPPAHPDARLWYQAIANYLWARRDFTEALPHVQLGLELYPGDAELLFVRGLIHEAQAQPPIQAAVEEQMRSIKGRRGSVYVPLVRSAEEERGKARDGFRRAIAADPQHVEARLHLAQVLNQDGDHAEAAQQLALVLAAETEPWRRYFAFLFLGRAEEARGRESEARAAYGEASALYLDAQAPRLALSQLDIRAGDREAALVVSEFLSRARPDDADPWSQYDAVRAPGAEVVWLQRLHDAFREPRR